jgi:predicted cobalt transporter CbtA
MRAAVTAARVVRWIAGAIAAILVVGILLVVLDANEDNALVGAILDVARFFGRPFRDMFELDEREVEIAVNWGIAVLVYLLVGSLIAAAIRKIAGAATQEAEPRKRGKTKEKEK